jgi:hypothetical protein
MRDLYDAPITDYAYTDPVGTVTRTVHRSYHGDKRKIWQGENTKARDLYRLPAVIEANKNDTTIYIVEGEKDVHVRPDRDSEAAVRGDASRASSSAHHPGASEIEPQPVVWAWRIDDHGRIPAGSLSIAAGREGTGKLSFGIWQSAQITKGLLPGSFLRCAAPRALRRHRGLMEIHPRAATDGGGC